MIQQQLQHKHHEDPYTLQPTRSFSELGILTGKRRKQRRHRDCSMLSFPTDLRRPVEVEHAQILQQRNIHERKLVLYSHESSL